MSKIALKPSLTHAWVLISAMFYLASGAVWAASPLLGPINSDVLTQRGISPRVLDVAIIPMSQGLRYESKVVYRQTDEDGSSGAERFRMTFDPTTEYGRDLYIELETEPLRSARAYRRMLEVTMGADHWLREQDQLHEAKSIKLASSEDGVDTISFHYAPGRIPTSLKWLTRLNGNVVVVDGVLNRVELVGVESFERDGIRHRNYRMTVHFGEVVDIGGYVITAIEESFEARLARRWQRVDVWSEMLEYSATDLGNIAWINGDLTPPDFASPGNISPAQTTVASVEEGGLAEVPVIGEFFDEELHSSDVIRLDLQRNLPLYADEVRKLGFELPKTYGLGLAAHYQKTDIDMKGFTVAGIDVTNDLPLVDPLGSDLESDVLTGQFRADMWVLPFLNVSVLFGEIETDSDVTLRFTPAFQALAGLGGDREVPEFYKFNTSTDGTTVGLGLLTGFQYEQLVMTLGLNYVETVTADTNSEIEALMWLGMVGYDFGAIGLQALAGVQYLDTDRSIEGSIDLADGEALDFSIDVGLEETTFMLGFNKDIGRNWTLSSFIGANGTKSSLTANFGYRW